MIWTHISELAVDRLLANEVDPVDAVAMRDHAADCARCGALLADAVDTQRAFAASTSAIELGLPIPFRPRRQYRVASLAIIATGLAAAFAMVVAWPKRSADEVRTKGAAIVGFFVAHGDHVRRGTLRETVVPGDRIELFTTTSSGAWFAAVGNDAAGQRTVYIEPRKIDAGREQVLPLSIELDATLGDETVTAMFCPERFDPKAPSNDCTTDSFTLVKVPR